jgi:hypothetical protein
MIIVLFPSGGFGSTIEYSLRQFSNELTKVNAVILDNGSMHSYIKEWHPLTIDQFLKKPNFDVEIATPVYPGFDNLPPADTIRKFQEGIPKNKKVVVISFDTRDMAIRNQLFVFHKVPFMIGNLMKNEKYKNWGADYNSFEEMKIFELREAISFFIDSQDSYMDVHKIIDKNWLCINTDDILYDFKNTILKIIDYCDLSPNTIEIDDFYNKWFEKQQYILNEFATTKNIVNCMVSDKYFLWQPISIMSEAIVQSELKRHNIEIACYNLDVFPTNTIDLKKIIIKQQNEY